MSGLPDLTSVYDGQIDSYDMNTANRIWANPPVLLSRPSRRGSNLEVPRADGEVPLVRRFGAVEVGLQIVFIGDVDENGTPNANPAKALIDTIDDFVVNVYEHVTATVPIWISDPGAGVWSGDCQLTAFDMGDTSTAIGLTTRRTLLTVRLPQPLVLQGSV